MLCWGVAPARCCRGRVQCRVAAAPARHSAAAWFKGRAIQSHAHAYPEQFPTLPFINRLHGCLLRPSANRPTSERWLPGRPPNKPGNLRLPNEQHLYFKQILLNQARGAREEYPHESPENLSCRRESRGPRGTGTNSSNTVFEASYVLNCFQKVASMQLQRGRHESTKSTAPAATGYRDDILMGSLALYGGLIPAKSVATGHQCVHPFQY